MARFELMSERLLIIATPLMISMNVGGILSAVSSIVIITYYLSKLKGEVVDVDYDGSWKKYLKSIFRL
jgi:hypothetical protein